VLPEWWAAECAVAESEVDEGLWLGEGEACAWVVVVYGIVIQELAQTHREHLRQPTCTNIIQHTTDSVKHQTRNVSCYRCFCILPETRMSVCSIMERVRDTSRSW
jgi:hypothetical protein